MPVDEWAHVTVTYDGSSRAAGVRDLPRRRAAPLEVVRDGLTKDITYDGGEPDLAIGYRFRDNGFKGGQVDEFRVFDRALTPLEVAHLAGRPDLTRRLGDAAGTLTAEQRDGLLEYYLATADPAATRLRASCTPCARSRAELDQPDPRRSW